MAILVVVALLLAVIAPIIGRLVSSPSAVGARSLADVSAVELTRNPMGLARALRTIADDPEVLEVANRATQHLYIVNPIKSFEQRSRHVGHPSADRRADRVLGSWPAPAAHRREHSRIVQLTRLRADRYALIGARCAIIARPRATASGAGRGSSVGRAPP